MSSPRGAVFAEVLTPTGETTLRRVDSDRVTDPEKNHASGSSTDTSDRRTSESTKKSIAPVPVAFADLYRFATPLDKLCLALGVLCAATAGALYPCMALVFGKAISAFQQADGGVDTKMVNDAAVDYAWLAAGLFVADGGAYFLLTTTAERQMKLLRAEALRHLLYMDIAWYDGHEPLQLASRITGDTIKIKDGMGSKLGEAIKYASQFVTGYAIGLAKGWDTTLVMAAAMPLMVLSMGLLVAVIRSVIIQSQQLYAEAGAVAEETLGAIRTVASLNAEPRAIAAYDAKCQVVEDLNVKLLTKASLVLGFFLASTWVMYAAGLWYGGYRVSTLDATPMEVFQSFFGVLLGTMAIALVTPSLTAVAEARGAAAGLYAILATPSAMDASLDEGFVPASCAGRIEALDLHFAYPSRPDAPILRGYSVAIEAGTTVAFVGASGGGKSTLVALLERFYTPQRGQLLLDGRDVRSLQLKWLRRQLGVVAQEPVLFAQSILDNIVAGASGEPVSRERVVEAAKRAHAHDFIMSLPQQYETLVGEKGVSLSGGQRQRLAIARAIVRDPAILVLDEATSALDVHSEREVQRALDELLATTRRTTLVIAHRLSTVRRADQIVVVSGGRVVEKGTHAQLLASGPAGVYRDLYNLQQGAAAHDEDHDPQDETEDTVAIAATDGRGPPPTRHSMRSLSSRKSEADSDQVIVHTDQKPQQDTRSFSVLDAVELSRPERSYFLMGAVAVAFAGFAMPGSALLLSELLTSMVNKSAQYEATRAQVYLDELYDDAATYGGVYLGGAAAMWALKATSTYCFRLMGQRLTTRVRRIQFAALCRQDIGFFDDRTHATGALTAALATHGANMASLSGDTLGRLVECVFTFVAAMAVSFALGSWKLSLVLLAIFPVLIASEAFRNNSVPKAAVLSPELTELGARASEALCSMRTVAALGLERALRAKFDALLDPPLRAARAEARADALAFGLSSSIVLATYALVFWYGGRLVAHREVSFIELMRTLMAVMMSAQSVGIAASYLGDSKHALAAGDEVVALRDRALPIDAFDPSGDTPAHVAGKIEFRDVTFAYPTRPQVAVLRHYDLVIQPGETVAFCGPSGGGKSTCIALLERFYDPQRGRVLLDGRDLRSLNVQWLRRQLALVGQEPTLFIGTIAQNIAYGLDPEPSLEAVQAAAKMANAHDFIAQFPDGYATQVGMKGEQLSGGQKQRIAIARAVLRDAPVLLLDEATSALDAESERVVQAALDRVVAQTKRTTLVIAHRLSTIRAADRICVVSGGRIAEQGAHAQLLAQNGIYAALVRAAEAQ